MSGWRLTRFCPSCPALMVLVDGGEFTAVYRCSCGGGVVVGEFETGVAAHHRTVVDATPTTG